MKEGLFVINHEVIHAKLQKKKIFKNNKVISNNKQHLLKYLWSKLSKDYNQN